MISFFRLVGYFRLTRVVDEVKKRFQNNCIPTKKAQGSDVLPRIQTSILVFRPLSLCVTI